jgi:MFS family permease
VWLSRDISQIIRRNTRLLSIGQALAMISMQINSIIAPLAVLKLSGDFVLSGFVFSISWAGRVCVSYISGWLMDKTGRRPVLVLGGIITVISLIMVGLLFLIGSIAGMIASFFLYGIGTAILTLNRVAITDMHREPSMGSAVGYLYTSSIVGSFTAIPFIALLESFSRILLIDDYTTLWIGAAIVMLPVILATIMIDPDTKEIMKKVGNDSNISASNHASSTPKSIPIIASFAVSALTSGIMVTMMSLLSLHMYGHGVPITLITISITIHVIGMYMFSIPIGSFVDKLGARVMMILGSLMTGTGGLFTPLTANYFLTTFAIFLVGIGWSMSMIATTAFIASFTEASLRGRVLGLNDMMIGVASMTTPLVGGFVIGSYGFFVFGLYGFLLSIPATAFALTIRRRWL